MAGKKPNKERDEKGRLLPSKKKPAKKLKPRAPETSFEMGRRIDYALELIVSGEFDGNEIREKMVEELKLTKAQTKNVLDKARDILKVTRNMQVEEIIVDQVRKYDLLVKAFKHMRQEDLVLQVMKQKEELLSLHTNSESIAQEREEEFKSRNKYEYSDKDLSKEEIEEIKKLIKKAVL